MRECRFACDCGGLGAPPIASAMVEQQLYGGTQSVLSTTLLQWKPRSGAPSVPHPSTRSTAGALERRCPCSRGGGADPPHLALGEDRPDDPSSMSLQSRRSRASRAGSCPRSTKP